MTSDDVINVANTLLIFHSMNTNTKIDRKKLKRIKEIEMGVH